MSVKNTQFHIYFKVILSLEMFLQMQTFSKSWPEFWNLFCKHVKEWFFLYFLSSPKMAVLFVYLSTHRLFQPLTITPSCWWVSSGGQPLLTPSWLLACPLPPAPYPTGGSLCRLPQFPYRLLSLTSCQSQLLSATSRLVGLGSLCTLPQSGTTMSASHYPSSPVPDPCSAQISSWMPLHNPVPMAQ